MKEKAETIAKKLGNRDVVANSETNNKRDGQKS